MTSEPQWIADAELKALVDRALAEDVGTGDVTTAATVPAGARARGRIVGRADGVAAGLDVARTVFHQLSREIEWHAFLGDGDRIRADEPVAELSGPARALLTGERTALNFLQRLSGVATLTRRFVDAVEGTGARILDTRKTTPALRVLEKAAVRAGGGHNHRFGLFDMALIKENHVAMAGGIRDAVRAARAAAGDALVVEVEVRNLDEFDEAVRAGAQRILLDNMSLEDMEEAVRRANRSGDPRPRLEASGNMSLERVRAVGRTGVDDISVGALTHSAPALDLSMLLELR